MASLRALAPSLTRITIAAAVGAALHIGKGDSDIVDQTAVDFSRAVLTEIEVDGEVISCEGPKDNAPAFNRREKVGTGNGPKVEFVIDPVDGTTATSKGRKDAISALACAPSGCFQVLPDDGYYFKVATDYRSKGKIAASVVTCIPDSGIDLLLGAGAGPEATIAATAVKCLGGTMLVKAWQDKKDDPNRLERLKSEGVDVKKTYTQDELARGDQLVFAASGVTKGELLDGVRFVSEGAIVNSICTRLPSGTFEKSETKLRFKGHPVYKRLSIS
jgi:fructose-1,6-bisphosphatase II